AQDQPGDGSGDDRLPSGAGLLAVAAKGGDLVSQRLDPGAIPAGDGHSEGKLQLFQLVVVFAAAH
ncbi:MAG: hypothetical protein ACKO58_07565, partial [Cyanobium sp.]